VRQRRLHSRVQAFGVDALHQLEALRRRALDGRPPHGAGVVDEHVELAAVQARGLVDERGDAVDVAGVGRERGRGAAGLADLARNGRDGRLRRVRIWREGA
jgi:hypothetical protein